MPRTTTSLKRKSTRVKAQKEQNDNLLSDEEEEVSFRDDTPAKTAKVKTPYKKIKPLQEYEVHQCFPPSKLMNKVGWVKLPDESVTLAEVREQVDEAGLIEENEGFSFFLRKQGWPVINDQESSLKLSSVITAEKQIPIQIFEVDDEKDAIPDGWINKVHNEKVEHTVNRDVTDGPEPSPSMLHRMRNKFSPNLSSIKNRFSYNSSFIKRFSNRDTGKPVSRYDSLDNLHKLPKTKGKDSRLNKLYQFITKLYRFITNKNLLFALFIILLVVLFFLYVLPSLKRDDFAAALAIVISALLFYGFLLLCRFCIKNYSKGKVSLDTSYGQFIFYIISLPIFVVLFLTVFSFTTTCLGNDGRNMTLNATGKAPFSWFAD